MHVRITGPSRSGRARPVLRDRRCEAAYKPTGRLPGTESERVMYKPPRRAVRADGAHVEEGRMPALARRRLPVAARWGLVDQQDVASVHVKWPERELARCYDRPECLPLVCEPLGSLTSGAVLLSACRQPSRPPPLDRRRRARKLTESRFEPEQSPPGGRDRRPACCGSEALAPIVERGARTPLGDQDARLNGNQLRHRAPRGRSCARTWASNASRSGAVAIAWGWSERAASLTATSRPSVSVHRQTRPSGRRGSARERGVLWSAARGTGGLLPSSGQQSAVSARPSSPPPARPSSPPPALEP